MAFIDKKDPVVLNIKLTSKGRELLSEGKLNFTYYGVGDSEIDYNYVIDNTYNPFYTQILKPVDVNPNILSFITKEYTGETYNLIGNVPSIPTIVENTAPSLGFFNITSGSTIFKTDSSHIKQPDAMVKLDNVSGGTNLELYKSTTYLANINEPTIGDFIMVRWTNKYDITGTTGYNINVNKPTPNLIYKIQSIVSGSLGTDNLIVEVDRELPNFSGATGTTGLTLGALIFYNYINFSGDNIYNDYSTDYASESLLTFLENCQCPTITFPFWNMSIIYTEEIAGVKSDNIKFKNFGSNKYGGFVSYIQNQSPIFKKLGVIHYSNSSPSNTYAEGFYVDTVNNIVPTLEIPTIMWHKSSLPKLGLKLNAYGSVKTLTGETKSLNTKYYDLADVDGNIVGKVFIDLKVFVIEDQELLFTMSYKSNRSWSLPNYSVGINDNIIVGCPTCNIDFAVDITNPTAINTNDGKVYIHNIINQIGGSKLILSVSGVTSGKMFFDEIIDETTVNNLSPDTYNVTIFDLGALNCEGKTITLSTPTSLLGLYDFSSTQSGLDPNFNLRIINPTTIRINRSDVGMIYGTGYTGILPYGSLSPVTYAPLINYNEYSEISFLSSYTIYVRDKYDVSTEFIVSKNYVAVGDPLNGTNFIVSSQSIDINGTFVMVSNYLTTITGLNPIIGDIEFSIYDSNDIPLNWVSVPNGTIMGEPVKVYFDGTLGTYMVAVREIYQTIEIYKYEKITIIS